MLENDRPEIHRHSKRMDELESQLAIAATAFGVKLAAGVAKNATKAFSRLSSAAIDYPSALLEGWAAERRAETEARVKLIEKSSQEISNQIEVDPQYARVAVQKFGEKILRERVNLDQISRQAALELGNSAFQEGDGAKEINEDWLNQFEKEACIKSTAEMQDVFAKILAGEIRRPSSFSIRAVRILGQMDSDVAMLFRRFCSASLIMMAGGFPYDGRLCAIGKNIGTNGLGKYGFSYRHLNILEEYGLINSDYNNWIECKYSIAKLKSDHSGYTAEGHIQFDNFNWVLLPTDKLLPKSELKLSGVSLSNAGLELQKVVGRCSDESLVEYKNEFRAFLKAQGFELTSFKKS